MPKISTTLSRLALAATVAGRVIPPVACCGQLANRHLLGHAAGNPGIANHATRVEAHPLRATVRVMTDQSAESLGQGVDRVSLRPPGVVRFRR